MTGCLPAPNEFSRQCYKPAGLQGALDARISGAVITASECCVLLAAMVIVLSMIGVNVSGLLLPAGIALAYAAKDLSHNFLAGAQPPSGMPDNPKRQATAVHHFVSKLC